MWTAVRRSTQARTDEDAAMAYVQYGSAPTRKEARELLIKGIHHELDYHLGRSGPYFSAYCIARLARILEALYKDSNTSAAESDGLMFMVYGRDDIEAKTR
jgi:hypothetical protein